MVHRRTADGVPEPSHACNILPAVLAEPSVRAAASRARAVATVWRARVVVGEAVARQHSGRAVWVGN